MVTFSVFVIEISSSIRVTVDVVEVIPMNIVALFVIIVVVKPVAKGKQKCTAAAAVLMHFLPQYL